MADIRHNRYQAIIQLDSHYEGSTEFVKATFEFYAADLDTADAIASEYASMFYGAKVDAVNQMT